LAEIIGGTADQAIKEPTLNNAERAKAIKKARTTISREPELEQRIQKSMVVAAPIIDALNDLGYKVGTLAELRHQDRDWKAALPLLLYWLPLVDDDLDIKQEIVRCLSVPWVGNKATTDLIADFKKYAPILPRPTNLWVGNQLREIPEEEKKLGPYFSLAWAIGNALSIVDVGGFEEQIIELCRNPKYGMARQMLVLGLGRLPSPEAEETAVELLRDEQVQTHAIGALGKRKSKRALFELERLLSDKRSAVRKEARKAITKIMR
jgi:hypothetical protein